MQDLQEVAKDNKVHNRVSADGRGPAFSHHANPESQPFSLRTLRAQAEIGAIGRALERTGWNRKQAATLLEISYRGLLYKIRQHKITRGSQPDPVF